MRKCPASDFFSPVLNFHVSLHIQSFRGGLLEIGVHLSAILAENNLQHFFCPVSGHFLPNNASRLCSALSMYITVFLTFFSRRLAMWAKVSLALALQTRNSAAIFKIWRFFFFARRKLKFRCLLAGSRSTGLQVSKPAAGPISLNFRKLALGKKPWFMFIFSEF